MELFYGKDEWNTIVQWPLKTTTPIVFIHGGAYVTEHNNFNDFRYLYQYIERSYKESEEVASHSFIYSINYRLSPKVKHPTHLLDLIFALIYLSSTQNVNSITIAGHSVGATLALQLQNYKQILQNTSFSLKELQNYQFLEKTFHSLDDFYSYVDSKLPVCRNLILMSGIYDFKCLLEQFPGYESWITEAFHTNEFSVATQINSYIKPLDSLYKSKIYIVHSYSDELVPIGQQNLLVQYLQNNRVPCVTVFDDFGKHDNVFENDKVGDLILSILQNN